MIVLMRGIWALLPKVGAFGLLFGGTVSAVDKFGFHDSFNPVVVDPKLDARTEAYIGVVRMTKRDLKAYRGNPAKLRQTAERWITRANEGKLPQIYPGYFGESMTEGPKGEIFTTCANLANTLSDLAEKESKAGDPNAMLDAVRAVELINIIRYGSFDTLFAGSSYLRRPLKTLKPNLSKLSPATLARLQKTQDINTRDIKIQMLNQVLQHLKTQYVARYGEEMASLDDSGYTHFIGKGGKQVAASHFYGFDREIGFKNVASR